MVTYETAGRPAGHVRIGYAHASTVRQSLDTQMDSLRASGVTRIFSEKISTRATTRPELDKAVALAREIRASGVAVTLVAHEHKRLGRGIELAALTEQLRAGDSRMLPVITGNESRPDRIRAHQRLCSGHPSQPAHPPSRLHWSTLAVIGHRRMPHGPRTAQAALSPSLPV